MSFATEGFSAMISFLAVDGSGAADFLRAGVARLGVVVVADAVTSDAWSGVFDLWVAGVFLAARFALPAGAAFFLVATKPV